MFATPLGIELKTIAINFMYKQEISAVTSMRNEKLNFSKMKFSWKQVMPSLQNRAMCKIWLAAEVDFDVILLWKEWTKKPVRSLLIQAFIQKIHVPKE